MFELSSLDSIQIGLASPEKIREWSHGEVTKAETINYRTLKPERDGLFCERIFGPTKDWECNCGKYKRTRFKGVVCDKCGVEVTKAKVRRERMGHIELAAPVSHIWYFKGIPSRIGTFLNITPKALEQVLYFVSYIVLDPGDTSKSKLELHQTLSENEYLKKKQEAQELGFEFRAGMGAEAIQEMLREVDLDELSDSLRDELDSITDQHNWFKRFEAIAKCTTYEEAKANRPEYLKREGERYFAAVLERANRYGMTEAHENLRKVLDYAKVLEDGNLSEHFDSYSVQQVLEDVRGIDMRAIFEGIRTDLKEINDRGNSKKDSDGQKRQRIIKRLEVVEAFRKSGNKPEWMVMNVVPVIPPELRPMVQLDGGRFATADLNDLYRRVINRNNRLKRMLEMKAPDIIVRNEKRMLQEAVDALIDNGRRGRAVTGAGGRALKSLSDLLRGKQGRFRQNLLGKRVDYSGRSVIVVGPSLKLYQCGLPKEMALELFKPFVIEKLVRDGLAVNVKTAKRSVERLRPEIWDVLEDVIKDHPVMLNRAPTLHRLGIQAFEPILVEGKALKLHPLCCTAFNADFDGDQMAVHVPLSMEAQAEARFLMLAANNILKLADGKPVICPTQDMVLGCYYLTMVHDGLKGTGKRFLDENEALMAYATNEIELESPCYIYTEKVFNDEQFIRLAKKTFEQYGIECDSDEVEDIISQYQAAADAEEQQLEPAFREMEAELEPLVSAYEAAQDDSGTDAFKNAQAALEQARSEQYKKAYEMRKFPLKIEETYGGVKCGKFLYTTIGRITFNKAVPQDMGMCVRETLDDMFKLELNEKVGKKQLAKIVDNCFRTHGTTITANTLDEIKALGYKYSTRAALTVSVADIAVPEEKKGIIKDAEAKVGVIEKQFRRGRMSENERYSSVIKIWEEATNLVTSKVVESMKEFNPINMMADSGARGSTNQIRQLAGMRGLMASPTGKTIELPIKANFREGLSVLEFFLSSHGSRKSLADTAMKTADSGYMTRRLVDVSQENIIREIDCFANRGERVRGLVVRAIGDPQHIIESLEDRIRGRVAAKDVIDPATGEVLVKQNDLITFTMAKQIAKAGVTEVEIRTVLTCQCSIGVCAKCYGSSMASGDLVDVGEAVGIIAAQSIGEPGTQLTMRTFHTGGVATGEDITQGLPRVEELFEARRPKREALLAEISGIVEIKTDEKKRRQLVINSDSGDAETKTYPINYDARLKIENGQHVTAGQELIDGSVNPHELLRILGVRAVQDYLVKEVQSVYRSQGVEIADKHIEVIVRQMLRKVKVEEANDTDLLPGSLVDIFRFDYANREAMEKGGRPASAKRILLGITKAALATESFLSAASFQETTRVLTEAAIKGKVDPLVGLKENVIIGKVIPAGTGLTRYSDISIHESY